MNWGKGIYTGIYGLGVFLGSLFFSCSDEPTPTPPTPIIEEEGPLEITSKPLEKIVEGKSGSFQVKTNKDGNPLEYSFTGNPEWLSINSETGLVKWEEQRVDEDTFYGNIELKVLDKEDSDSDTQNWNISIEDTVKYFSVSPGESIQDVIDSIDGDDGFKHVIEVASGLYNENLNINKNISLIGAGNGEDGTIIESLNPSAIEGVTYSEYKPTILINASGKSDEPILLDNIRINLRQDIVGTSQLPGILFKPNDNISYVTLKNLYINGTNSAGTPEQGITIDGNTNLEHLVIMNSKFNNMAYGIISHNNKDDPDNPTMAQYITITNSEFKNNSIKGFYTEKLSDALLENLIVMNNGNTDLSDEWADPYNAGIDINLKYGNYQNIVLRNIEATGNGIGSINGAGLTIKARGTGNDPSYSSNPATLDNVLIDRGNYTGNNSYDIRFGEPNKDNTSPTNINLINVNYETLSNELDGVTVIDNKIFCMP